MGERHANSIIYEVRRDDDGEFYHLVTLWEINQRGKESVCRKRPVNPYMLRSLPKWQIKARTSHPISPTSPR